jgi:hypothetical protein
MGAAFEVHDFLGFGFLEKDRLGVMARIQSHQPGKQFHKW